MENSVTAAASEKFTEKSAAELGDALDAKIPRDAVSTRSGGGAKQLSYLETWYVIDRMNKVFGHLNWSCETYELRLIEGTDKPTYLARVCIIVNLNNGRSVMKDGVGYGSDKSGMNPHEMAAKEAESDAFKRAAKNFGLSLGLALYAKDEDLIDDSSPKEAVPVLASANVVGNGNSKSNRVAGVSEKPESAEPAKENPNRAQVNQLITETSKVIAARRIKTTPEIKLYIKQTFGVDTKEQLDDEQAGKLLAYLKSIL